MTAKKRSWQEKLTDSKDFPRICDAAKSKRGGTDTFVIPAPLEVDALMKKVRRGKLTTIDAIRKKLAKKHKTTIAWPLKGPASLKRASDPSWPITNGRSAKQSPHPSPHPIVSIWSE